MARKPTVAQAIESTTAEAFEAVEQDAPEGVIEGAIDQDLLTTAIYMVRWHIKAGGRRYGPGDDVALTEQQAAPFVASGAIEKA